MNVFRRFEVFFEVLRELRSLDCGSDIVVLILNAISVTQPQRELAFHSSALSLVSIKLSLTQEGGTLLSPQQDHARKRKIITTT